MKQNSKIEYYIPLILAVAMLMAVCLPMLGLPYCYREAEIMSDSILFLRNHGLGLVMNREMVEFPNLFSVLFYGVASFLGSNPWILHSISLGFSAMSIVLAYKFGKFFFSMQAGVMSASLMCVQNVYMAQTGLVLPVMMLNMCILGGLYMFFREKYFWCMIMMLIATLTDITGLAASLIILISYLKIQYKEWTTSKNIMLSIPILAWAVMEMASIYTCGRFSIRHIEFSPMNFVNNLYFIFIAQYRFVITVMLIIMVIVNANGNGTLYFVRDMAKKCVGMLAALYICNSLISAESSWNLTTISLLCIFTGCTISSMPISYPNKYIITCVIMMASALSVLHRNQVDDSTVNYKSKIKVDMMTVSVVEDGNKDESAILCDKYFYRYLTSRELGYCNMRHNCVLPGNDTIPYRWAIYSNFDTTSAINTVRDNADFTKFSTVFKNDYTNEIYKRNK